MPLNQYVYFALSSERTTAKEMAAVLGIEPDETTVRASRLAEPSMPVCHRRKIVCRAPGLRVDEQVAQILDRLRPQVGRIAELARQLAQEGEGDSAVLQVVRYSTMAQRAWGFRDPRSSRPTFRRRVHAHRP
ncbi:DUF4279 domain-containing protein [Streptomyces sp. NPDC091376]|uniref:DUF4279 domain-containing protein n=1 Tax=Streptomyces sp. NPDC091376 TaxID=3365994 RepID=UPI0037F219AC